MHDHDHDHGIRARAARIRKMHDDAATRLEERRRSEALAAARIRCLVRLRMKFERLEETTAP